MKSTKSKSEWRIASRREQKRKERRKLLNERAARIQASKYLPVVRVYFDKCPRCGVSLAWEDKWGGGLRRPCLDVDLSDEDSVMYFVDCEPIMQDDECWQCERKSIEEADISDEERFAREERQAEYIERMEERSRNDE